MVNTTGLQMLLTCVSLGSILALASAEEGVHGRRPNLILITIDNHNTSVLGFAGNRLLETPNIDRLAREGVFFSNYHTASRCSASRAAMLTGRYHLRSGGYPSPLG